MKALIRKIPGAILLNRTLHRMCRDFKHRRLLRKLGEKQNIFEHFYNENTWGNSESKSGSGSTLEYTENLRKELPNVFKEYDIHSMLDAPCGDYNWFQHVERDGVNYIGGDIVEPLIKNNNSQHANEQTKFIHVDITSDPLPNVDLWLCRDCLFHLPLAEVKKALRQFQKSNMKYLLTSVHPHCTKNTDILPGDFRLISLELSPFGFPPALAYIDDWVDGAQERQMALWSREQLTGIEL